MKVNLFLACLLGTKKMAIKAWYWSWNKNKFFNYKHFKMVSINNVINLIKLNVYMTSIYLKDAFFSVPIPNDYQKYLMFRNLLQFTSMPNGYGFPMRIFTKISKVPFGHLRSPGYNSVVYEADSYLQAEGYQSCLTTI